MRGRSPGNRLIALVLVLCMAAPQLAQGVLADKEDGRGLAWEEIEDYGGGDKSAGTPTGEYKDDSVRYDPDDLVRVSIVPESASTMDAGYDITRIAEDPAAAAYRESLRDEQLAVAARIGSEVLDGETLDVVWNLTLTVNIISANVLYGQIDAIKAVEGVSDVFVENKYAPERTEDDLTVDPQMATSGSQIGSTQAWEAGYTGAGSRIAVIDTGIDYEHKSFDPGAFLYSLRTYAQEHDMDPDEYIDSLDLLTAAEIERVKDQLNVFQDDEDGDVAADRLYRNEKVAFAYNYVDSSYTVDHANDGQSEHGSHVAGIAAANKFVNVNFGNTTKDPNYQLALAEVKVQGVAPDAQLIVMKIFGKSGSGNDSDIFAALEDAIVLGCDSVNLSLGSNNGGYAYAGTYETTMKRLIEEEKIVMVAASGNYYSWAEYSQNVLSSGSSNGYLHGDDVNFLTGGFPGTYPNSLTVASVNNNGGTGMYITVLGKDGQDDKVMVYWESNGSYGVKLMSFLGSDRSTKDYIFMDCCGTEEEFDAVGKENIEGKVVFVNRGGGVTFIEKATRAAERGALAVVIINDQSGTYSFAMTEYAKKYDEVPVANVNQYNRQAIIERGEKETIGSVDCYTGRMKISMPGGSFATERYGDDYSYMSYYSSWGVPGTLELKPEIAAPGGNIYSVNGKANSYHEGYENMSGTSMAAPQVSGMAALIAQYIRQNGLEEKLGLRQRQIITSLLMSTATPIINKLDDDAPNSAGQTEPFYSVMWQGAGLANVGSVINATSFITMEKGSTLSDAYLDGKVKAEVGANENGEYDFAFTVHNFSDAETGFDLNTELFTQDLIKNDNGTFLDQTTAPLLAAVTYTANGEEVDRVSTLTADVDCDGDTDGDDAQAILDKLVGKYNGEYDEKAADVDNDGGVTTYDAHLILSSIASEVITVPAGDKVTIGVRIQILSDVSDYVNGAYVEGYTFVVPIADEEGADEGVEHSIPILGFYGNWSDPSMFERNSYVDSLYGDTTQAYFTAPVPVTVNGDENDKRTVYEINYLTYYDKTDRMEYTFLGNPYGVEDTFPAGRGAIRSDQEIRSYTYALIRNAGVTALVIRDHNTGGILDVFNINTLGYDNIGAYHTSNGWKSTSVVNSLRRTPKQLDLEEDQTVDVCVLAIPEYYTNKYINEGSGEISPDDLMALIESDVLGEGVWLTTTLTVDDTKPEIADIIQTKDGVAQEEEDKGDITVTLRDNQHIAYIGLKTRSGVQVIREVYGPDPDAGTTTDGGYLTYTFHLSEEEQDKIGTQFMLVVGDYAGNQTAARVTYEGGEDPDYTGMFFAIAKPSEEITSAYKEWTDNTWFSFVPSEIHADVHSKPAVLEGATAMAYSTVGTVTAAEYVDGYVFYVNENDILYVASIYELEAPVIVSDLAAYGLTDVTDISFNYQDSKLYAMNLTGSRNNPLWQIDPLSGAATRIGTVDVEGGTDVFQFNSAKNIVSFAIDGEGNFYGATRQQGWSDNNCSRLVKWRVDDLETTGASQTIMATVVGPIKDGGTYVQENDGSGDSGGSMTWDLNEDKLYLFNFCGSNGSFLKYDYVWEVNTENASAKPSQLVEMEIQGLFCVSEKKPDDLSFEPTDEVTGIVLDTDELELYVTGSEEIGYYLTPWTLTEDSQAASWSSEDPNIAAVDEYGVVTGVAVGSTTVTCTVGDVTVECPVTVKPIPDITLTAAVYDEDAHIYWSDFNVADPTKWEPNSEDVPYAVKGGTLADDGCIYVHNGADVYRVDPDTYEDKYVGPLNGGYIWSDAAMTTTVSDRQYTLAGLNSVGEALTVYALYDDFVDLYDLSRLPDFNKDYDRAAVLAYEKTASHRNYAPSQMPMDKTCLTDFYYMLTEKGRLYRIYIFPDDGISSELYGELLGTVGEVDLTDVALQGESRATMIFDKTTGLLVLVSYIEEEGNDRAMVQLIDPDRCKVVAVTYFQKDVWPVVSAFQHTRITDLYIKAPRSEFDLKAGISVDTNATLIWDKTHEGLTWESKNEAVAKVDDKGIITGVDSGTTTVVATTVGTDSEGQHVSKEFTVHVKGPDKIDIVEGASVRALVQFADGTSSWVEIPLNNTLGFTKIEGTPAEQHFLTGGGIGADGYIYGSSIELSADSSQIQGTFYKVDPTDNYAIVGQTDDWWWQTAAIDMANTPDGRYGLMLTLDTGSTADDEDPSYKHGAYVLASDNAMKPIDSNSAGTPMLSPNVEAITWVSKEGNSDKFVGLTGNQLYVFDVTTTLDGEETTKSDVRFSRLNTWWVNGPHIDTDPDGGYPLNHTFRSSDNLSMITTNVQYKDSKYIEFVVVCADGNTVDLYTFSNYECDESKGNSTTVYYLGSIPGATDISCLHTLTAAEEAAKHRDGGQGDEPVERVPDKITTDAKVRAQVRLKDGTTAWVEIPLNDVTKYNTIVKDAGPFLNGGGLGAGGYIYGSDDSNTFYKIDPTQEYTQTASTENWPAEYAPVGMAYSPNGDYGLMLTGTNKVSGAYVMAYNNAMKAPNASLGEPKFDTEQDAVAYYGVVSKKDRFYGIVGDRIYYTDVGVTLVDGEIVPDSLNITGPTSLGWFDDNPLEMSFNDMDNVSMLHIIVDEQYSSTPQFVVACVNGDSVDIYYFIKGVNEGSCTKVYYLGTLPEVTNISCLHTIEDADKAAENRANYVESEEPVEPEEKVPEQVMTDAMIRALIQREDGSNAWVEIPLSDLSATKVLNENTGIPFLTGGGLGAGGYVYGSDIAINGKQDGTYYKIDPKDDSYEIVEKTAWGWQGAPVSITYCPTGYGMVLTNDTTEYSPDPLGDGAAFHRGAYVLGPDVAMDKIQNDVYGVAALDRPFAAAAYYGVMGSDSDQFVFLDEDRLYTIQLSATISNGKTEVSSATETRSWGYPLDESFSLEDHPSMVKAAVNNTAQYRYAPQYVIACKSGYGVEIYYFITNESVDGHTPLHYLGLVPGATDISCLHVPSDVDTAVAARLAAAEPQVEVQGTEPETVLPDEQVPGAELPETPVTEEAVETTEPVTEEVVESAETETEEVVEVTETEETETVETANEVTGGLMAIDAERPSVLNAGTKASAIDADAHTVTVNVSANDSTNGFVTVTYDPTVLTLTDVKGGVDHFAYSDDQNGTVRIAFAAGDPIDAYAATLVFAYGDEYADTLDTQVKMTVTEDGSDVKGYPKTEEVSVKLHATFDLTVNFVDENGSTLRSSIITSYEEGADYSVSIPGISGYNYSRAEGSLTGTMTGDVTVTLVYVRAPYVPPTQPDELDGPDVPDEPDVPVEPDTPDDPGTDLPDDEPPLSDEPGADEPGTNMPDEEPPLSEEPGKDDPGTDLPDDEPPLSEEPGTDDPGTDLPDDEPPLSEEPGTDDPGTDLPDEEPPLSEEPGKKDDPTDGPPMDETPKTGDESVLDLWLIAMALSGAMTVLTFTASRKKREEQDEQK